MVVATRRSVREIGKEPGKKSHTVQQVVASEDDIGCTVAKETPWGVSRR
jgi:hypothetical protein